VSQLSHKFTSDAREVVKTGDIVKVRVVEVDLARKRIALSMKLGDAPVRRDAPRENRFESGGRAGGARAAPGALRAAPAPASTAMQSAFARLQKNRSS
jgi:uncharacterized protein